MASLHDRFQQAVDVRAGARQPSTVRGAMERYGWSTRDLAQKLGVSERTARRYARENRITAPGAAAADARRGLFRQEVHNAARGRQRARMERGGIGQMSAGGEYEVSPGRRYRTGPSSRVRTSQAKIPPAAMRDYWAAVDRGDAAEADQILNDALAAAYDAPGLHMTDVDDVNFTI